jgi:hypothetical protein
MADDEKSLRVYVAGPYTDGDQAMNVRRVVLAADALVAAGHVPFVPHLYHFWHLISPKPYEVWMRLDAEWLTTCDAMIRLPGKSSGSDREVELAGLHGLPVYESVEEFLRETRRLV